MSSFRYQEEQRELRELQEQKERERMEKEREKKEKEREKNLKEESLLREELIKNVQVLEQKKLAVQRQLLLRTFESGGSSGNTAAQSLQQLKSAVVIPK